MARLSVNLNKIALLRNSRHTGVPGVDLPDEGAGEATKTRKDWMA